MNGNGNFFEGFEKKLRGWSKWLGREGHLGEWIRGSNPFSQMGGVRPIEKESPLIPEKRKHLLFRDQGTLFFYPAHCLAMFANFVYSGLQTRLIVPIGPFLCLAIITSAILGISVSLL